MLQMSMILAVAGVAVSATIPGGKSGGHSEKYLGSMERLTGIERALTTFRAIHGRLPCPADGTLSIDNANAGQEASDAGECTGGAIEANFSSGNVVGGIIPYAALGLQERDVRDEWGRWITYVADKRATEAEQCQTLGQGDILIDQFGANVNTMFAFIIHGPSGLGAFAPARGSSSGVRLKPPATDADALLNASLDGSLADDFTGQFVKKDLVPGTFESVVWYPKNRSNVCCYGASNCAKCGGNIDATPWQSHTMPSELATSGPRVVTGDLNGDGLDDIIFTDGDRTTNTVYVVFGTPSLPEGFDIGGLDGSNGFSISLTAEFYSNSFGDALAVDDVNGDGRNDLVVYKGGGGMVDPSQLYVFFGKDSYDASYLAGDLADGTQGFVVNMEYGWIQYHHVATGHFKGSAYADIAFTYYHFTSFGNQDETYIALLWGGPGPWQASYDIDTLIDGTGTNGMKIAGGLSFHTGLAAGDVNGDGLDDLMIRRGSTYLLFGDASLGADLEVADLTGTVGKRFTSTAIASPASPSLTFGDFNGDGIKDIGLADNLTNGEIGYVMYGSVTARADWPDSFDMTTLSGATTPAGFKILGTNGLSYAAAGDVDSDGYDDLLFGQLVSNGMAWGDKNQSRSILLYGSPSMGDTVDFGSASTIFDGQQAALIMNREGTVGIATDVRGTMYPGTDGMIGQVRERGVKDIVMTVSDGIHVIGRCKFRCGNFFEGGGYGAPNPPTARCDDTMCGGANPCIIPH